ncbi:hypothetical protein GCM10022240_29900 [Microbacterium kribbense]|uniref:Uncharacterized protein n=1 Tax=Microbacterium kribbense TaxID=433645 RepID=A0ABP7H2C5_9MICO
MLIEHLDGTGVVVTRGYDKAKCKPKLEVAQVAVGNAYAKTNFQYTQRIREQIPSSGGMYSVLSGIAHGEMIPVSTAWETPDTLARVVGTVVHQSVSAWSRAVHDWVGVTPAPFLNQSDIDDLIASMPEDFIADFRTNTAH